MSLIHAEKFEFENPTVIEDKQCEQMERSLVMAKENDNFLLLDDKSKQIYKVKINNICSVNHFAIWLILGILLKLYMFGFPIWYLICWHGEYFSRALCHRLLL